MSKSTVGTVAAPLIAGSSLGLSHLLASVLDPTASPLVLVGDVAIALTPTPVKTWAIDTFGTWDKLILVGSMIVVVLLIAALAGRKTWQDRWARATTLLTIAAIPAFIAFFLAPFALTTLLPSLALVAFAYLQLHLWSRLLPEAERPNLAQAVGAEEIKPVSRRGVLRLAALTGLVGAAAGIGGQAISRARLAIRNVTLPAPAVRLAPKVSNFDSTPGITPLVTPVEDFYRVDINLTVPLVDQDEWTLTLAREGYDDITYTYDELLAMELVERDITLICVSNSVGGRYTGSGRWLGVDLMDLLSPLNPEDDDIDQLFATSVDGYTSSSPLKYVTDGREGMIAVGYNGEVLTREHGFPARLLIPGLYGFVGATKWVKRLELTTYAKKEAYWTRRDWATDAPIRPMARIDAPRGLTTTDPDTVIAGVAWAGTLGVSRVEVSLDGGPWQAAEVDKPSGPEDDWDYWVQWRMPVKLATGPHSVSARCVTKDDVVQEAVRREPFPSGASGWHSLNFTVR